MHWELGPATESGLAHNSQLSIGSQIKHNIQLFHSTGIFRGIANRSGLNVRAKEEAQRPGLEDRTTCVIEILKGEQNFHSIQARTCSPSRISATHIVHGHFRQVGTEEHERHGRTKITMVENHQVKACTTATANKHTNRHSEMLDKANGNTTKN